MKKIVNLLEKGIITLALGFLLLTGISFVNSNAFADINVVVKVSNLEFEGIGGCPYYCCHPEGGCELEIHFTIPEPQS